MPTVPVTERRTLVYPSEMRDPQKWLNFVQLSPFERAWERLGLNDDDLRALEIFIMLDPQDPTMAPVIKGTGGARKMRFAPRAWKTGKRGAARVIYAYFEQHGVVALIHAYAKNEEETIDPETAKQIKTLIDEIEAYLDKPMPRKRATPEKGQRP